MSAEVKHFKELFEQAKSARLPYDREIWLNIAFFLDHPYVRWNTKSNALEPIPRSKWESNTSRVKSNKIFQFVMQSLASSMRDKPTPDVLPTSIDPVDTMIARVSQAYVQWLADPQVEDFDDKLANQAGIWAMAGGEAFLKWTYSSEKEQGCITACSPLDIYADPYAQSFKDCRYVFHTQFMDVNQVEDVWGVKVKPTKVDKSNPLRNELLQSMGVVPTLQGADVKELWMKKCTKYPNGLYCVFTDDQVISYEEKFPYEHGHLPFTQLGVIPIPGTYHRTSFVTYLRQLQRELNKYHTQRTKIRENFASPKWRKHASTEMKELPNDAPNQILEWEGDPNLPPEIVAPIGMADNDEGSWINSEMMHTAGIHEVSQAQVPGRVEAARAIELLKESDDDRLAFFNKSVDAAIGEGFWQELQLAKQFMSEEKILTIYSNDGIPQTHKFKSEEIPEGQRLRVQRSTGLARSRAARTDQVINLVQNGLLRDTDRALQLLELNPVMNLHALALDQQLAETENLQMADGTAVVPHDYDDHATHIVKHNEYRKTQEYQTASDDVKSKFEFHVEQHEKLQIEALQKQQQLQQLLQPVVPPEGENAPPDVV